MPNLKQTKSNTFSTISSYRTLVNNYKDMVSDTVNSFKSLSTGSVDPVDYLIDLFKAFASEEELTEVITNILVTMLGDIELSVKETLKSLIREYISCNVDPSIIDSLFDPGVYLSLEDIDFLNLLRKSPGSADGDLYYFDITENLYDSKDFNTFLYYVVSIYSGSSGESDNLKWGLKQQVWSKNILSLFYNESNITQVDDISKQPISHPLRIRVDDNYKVTPSNQDRLSAFNSDFVDSVQLFDSKTLTAKLIDTIFGPLSASTNRSVDELLLEAQIEKILGRISNCTDSSEVDDSYFSFSNDDYNEMLSESEMKKFGLTAYNANNLNAIKLTTTDLKETLNAPASTLVEQKAVVESTIDNMANALANDPNTVTPEDKFNLKLNIIKSLIKQLSVVFTTAVLSPKMYILIALNLRLLGLSSSNDIVTIMKENKLLISGLVQAIKDRILDILVEKISTLATDLAGMVAKRIAQEQMKLYKNYILSLLPGGSFLKTLS